ncbi:MAG TPA: kelch repeat-containing protein [Chitinophagales bacterium]|nr:kelch repeat-containing protein [Chitinophagales bacterium]
MKNIFTLLISFLPIICHSQGWTQKADFGSTARRSSVAISINGKGYVGTGYNSNFYKDWWEYDPVADTWTQKADFGGTARFSAVAFAIDSLGYVGTGYDVNNNLNTSDFYSYNPSTNSWSAIASMPNARRYAVGLSINTKGYVGTGANDSGYLNDFYEYDPATNAWTAKTNFPGAARYECVAISFKGKGYIGIGAYSGTLYHDFYEYSPETDSWMQRADYPGSGQDAAFGFAIADTGYMGGGGDQQNAYSDFWGWDQISNTWVQKADFGGAPRTFGVGVSIGTKGYAGLGEQANYFNDWWEYSPDTSSIPTVIHLISEENFFISALDENIFIHHQFFRATFLLYDLNGRKIFSCELNESNKQLKIDEKNFGEGIFLYAVRDERKIIFSGKVELL